ARRPPPAWASCLLFYHAACGVAHGSLRCGSAVAAVAAGDGEKAHGMERTARMRRHRPRRMGDGRMTAAPIPCGAARGFTLIELLVTLPHASRDEFNLWTAQTQLLGDLRTVRTNAITKGVHYQVVLTASGYTMNRM